MRDFKLQVISPQDTLTLSYDFTWLHFIQCVNSLASVIHCLPISAQFLMLFQDERGYIRLPQSIALLR